MDICIQNIEVNIEENIEDREIRHARADDRSDNDIADNQDDQEIVNYMMTSQVNRYTVLNTSVILT